MQLVSSARAAQIVGVGYEGFRSYLKRGLLGRVGMLPGFHAPGAGTSDDPSPRSGWKKFGLADLTLMRLAKMLMDAGYAFTSANSVVSRQELWSLLQHELAGGHHFLLVWPPYGDHILFGPEDFHHLPDRMAEAGAQGVTTLINLADVQREVAQALAQPA
jgi:hypothetical protein